MDVVTGTGVLAGTVAGASVLGGCGDIAFDMAIASLLRALGYLPIMRQPMISLSVREFRGTGLRTETVILPA